MFQCVNCQHQFKTEQELKRHANRKNNCNRILQCSNCYKIFKTKQNLEKHKNNKNQCIKINLELKNENLELKNENLELKNENLELKLQVASLNQKTINNITNNNIIINNFGNENLGHIDVRKLNKQIFEIINKNYHLCDKKIMKYKDLRYSYFDIKIIDVYNMLIEVIYLSKEENRTIKKENNKFYIRNDNWNEIVLDDLTLGIFIKQQETLILAKSLVLFNDKNFKKIKDKFFDRDDNSEHILEVGNIDKDWFSSRLTMFKKLIDYKLENENDIYNHVDNIIK